MEKKEVEQEQEQTNVEKVFAINKKEAIIVLVSLVALSLLSAIILLFRPISSNLVLFSYVVNCDVIIKSSLLYLIISLCVFLGFKPLFHPNSNLSTKNIIWLAVLIFFGYLAEIVINIIFIDLWHIQICSYPISTFVVSIYLVLVYHLIFRNGMESRSTFWEIFRFAIVGAIAAVFDFVTTSLFRFVIFKNSTLNPALISSLSVFFGFIVGVIINYVCSITMVFSNKGKNSRKLSGIILFVILGAVGLGIGIGLEILFYDYCKLPEPVSFILRTLVVLIWNYVSRKLFIFKK